MLLIDDRQKNSHFKKNAQKKLVNHFSFLASALSIGFVNYGNFSFILLSNNPKYSG